MLDFFEKFRKTIYLILNGLRGWIRMLQEKRLEISRNCWKKRAVLRGTKLRELRKDKRRHLERIEQLKEELKKK